MCPRYVFTSLCFILFKRIEDSTQFLVGGENTMLSLVFVVMLLFLLAAV